MPRFVNWLLRLLLTNPICMRLIQGGSRRLRHLYIRSAYLGIMIVVLLFVLLQSVAEGGGSMRDLAAGGATMFEYVSILQVALICILAPVFMAGAIAQEANPRTWDILLTTPLNSLQVVLGNLFGRLFFILALLLSSLPLFAVTQYFGGVRLDAIFASYAIAGASALLVAAIAITLSVTRTAGRRAVFVFYITVIMYLFVTFAIDWQFLRESIAPGSAEQHTTIMTPLNPFLALLVLLRSNEYVPHDVMDLQDYAWLARWWLSSPIAAFVWVCVLLSTILIAFSTIRLRVIGATEGTAPWYRRMFGLAAKGAMERPPRPVGRNPVAWREAVARGKSLPAVLGRWGFCAAGVLIAIIFITMYHVGLLSGQELQTAILTVVGAEIMIITLAALNLSATAVTREREDGTLDIILTTPIQPGPYIAGKLQGLIQFLLPMILVPVTTLVLMALYVMTNGLGGEQGGTIDVLVDNATVTIPLVLPEGSLLLPLVLAPFVAFCVMVGLQWSIKSKGTIGAVIASVGIIIAVVGVVSLCGYAGGQSLSVVGAVLSAFSPGNMAVALVRPDVAINDAVQQQGIGAARIGLFIGAFIAAAAYAALVYGMHTNMKRTFMMTVRKLAGAN
jgi:ABC-type transport system involved in multi-copper enzyme maturation permease subunit